MPTDKNTPTEQDAMQETIYVLIRKNGDFLCAGLGRFHSFMWSNQIAKALRGNNLQQAEQRIAKLLDKIEDMKVRRIELEADLYRADIVIASSACIPDRVADERVRADFVRMIGICDHRPTYHGFSTAGRFATRPSKAVGFSTLSLAGDGGRHRIIQLKLVKGCGYK